MLLLLSCRDEELQILRGEAEVDESRINLTPTDSDEDSLDGEDGGQQGDQWQPQQQQQHQQMRGQGQSRQQQQQQRQQQLLAMRGQGLGGGARGVRGGDDQGLRLGGAEGAAAAGQVRGRGWGVWEGVYGGCVGQRGVGWQFVETVIAKEV